MIDLKNKKILISGASRGIGLETIKILLQKGAIVHNISRERPPIQNSNLYVHLADLYTTIPEINEFFDIVILNLGVNPGQKLFDELHVEEVKRTIFLNLTVHLLILKTVKYKNVVFVDSILSMVGLPYNSLYCSCKSFISTFNESLRREGVDTYIIYPYKVNTDLFPEIKDFLTLDKKTVAKTIVADIQSGRKERVIPWIFNIVPLLKSILPIFVIDWIAKISLKILTKSKTN